MFERFFSTAYCAFISTFHYISEESESDLSDLNLNMFECGEITPEVENMLDNT